MKKIFIVIVLMFGAWLISCGETTGGYWPTAEPDYQAEISSLEARITDLEEYIAWLQEDIIDGQDNQAFQAWDDRYISEDELRNALDVALAEFYQEIQDELQVDVEIEMTPELKAELVQMLYDFLDYSLSEDDVNYIVTRLLEHNGFYEEYNEQAYAYIEQFWQELLLDILEEMSEE